MILSISWFKLNDAVDTALASSKHTMARWPSMSESSCSSELTVTCSAPSLTHLISYQVSNISKSLCHNNGPIQPSIAALTPASGIK